MTYHAKVIAGGKIVIPADLRREFGIRDGDTLVVARDPDGGLSVKTFEQVVRETQREARAIFGPDYTVEQFVRENRADWGDEG
ncbi:AbrB/MazE/SpoVT family DNA-binding domain-containing protein [Sphingomonas sp.]|uniref:AbrB/MazE/SpoVT family DNA-binding domain-containing protein n=1 Tax=Sphingomonas sp. TaxID=28214 RepID=UPI003AFFEA24